MLHKKFLNFLCFFVLSSTYAQFSISGIITNKNKEVLSGSHIHFGSKSVIADKKGHYIFRNIQSGQTKIVVTYIGYATIDTLVTVNNNLILNLVLKQTPTNLSEILIHQDHNSLNQSVLEQKLKLDIIERYSNQTLGDALKEVAGVSLLKTGATIVKPIINGLHSSRVPIINNNVRLEDQQWGAEHAPNFDVNAAGKITVIKGASGLQYGGDAVGGLVIIEPISVKKDTLYGKTLLNLASNGNGGSLSTSMHKGNFCDWSWNVLGTFKYSGDKSAPNYVLSNTGNREINFSGDVKFSRNKYDFSAYYSYYSAQIGILKASHIGNVSDLYQSINNKVPAFIDDFTYQIANPKQIVHHHLFKTQYNLFLDDETKWSFQYAFQYNKRLEFDVRRNKFSDIAALDLELLTQTLLIDFKKNKDSFNLKSGFSASYQDNFANPKTGIRPLIPSYSKVDIGLYAISEHNIGRNSTFEYGIRYDFSNIQASKYYIKSRWDERNYSPEFDHFIRYSDGNQWFAKPTFTFHNLSASLGLHQKWSASWDWYLNSSLATRNPNPSEFFSDGLHHATGMIELGDLRLQKEQSLKIATTFNYKTKIFDVALNPFFNQIANYMFLKPIGFETNIRGAFPVWEYQQTSARLFGMDIQARFNVLTNWQYSLVLSYVNGYDISNSQSLIDMSPIRITNKIQFNKSEWNGFLMFLQSEIVGNQNRYPNFNFTTNIVNNGELVPVYVDISTPPLGYHLLNFYSEITLNKFKKTTTKLAFSIQNIFNTNYRDYLNKQRFFVDEMGRNFQLQIKINY